jgi:hypothetical protein
MVAIVAQKLETRLKEECMHSWPRPFRATAHLALTILISQLVFPAASAVAETGRGSASAQRLRSTGVEQFMVDQASSGSGLLAESAPQSPCDDPQYLELKKKPVGSLTQQEFAYFQEKDKECYEYQRSQIGKTPEQTAQATPAPAPAVQNGGMSAGWIVLLAIAGTVVFLVVLGAIANH